MINNAGESGMSRNSWRRGMRELVTRNGCANTRPAGPIRLNRKGALAIMMPEHPPLQPAHHAVSSTTVAAV